MSLLRIGVDEAGYGPILGPLCVAAFSTTDPPGAGGLDSKRIFRPGRLDRLISVCARLDPGTVGGIPGFAETCDQDEPWMQHPVPDDVLGLFSPEAQGCAKNVWVELNCAHAVELNREFAQRNKAEVLSARVGGVLMRSLHHFDAQTFDITVDRLGGRTRYGPLVESWGFTLQEARERREISWYRVRWRGREGEISFRVGADRHVDVVGAASCFAKLRREVAMARLNAWWTSACPGLRPTAGYWVDGLRFLKDIASYCEKHNIHTEILRRSR